MERLASLGCSILTGIELEFMLLHEVGWLCCEIGGLKREVGWVYCEIGWLRRRVMLAVAVQDRMAAPA